MDKRTVEARIERLFKEAKPRSRIKKSYSKLAGAFILATITLSVTKYPSSTLLTEPPIKPAIVDDREPAIHPSVLTDTDETLVITVNQPSKVFSCGCAHTRTKTIDTFAASYKLSDI